VGGVSLFCERWKKEGQGFTIGGGRISESSSVFNIRRENFDVQMNVCWLIFHLYAQL